jgi:hypothetical protein
MALVPGVRPILEVGGRVFTDLTNLIVLFGSLSGNSNTTLRKPADSAGYTPSGSKTYVMWALSYKHSAANEAYYGYADNDVGINAAPGLTNAMYPGNDGTLARFVYEAGTDITSNEMDLGKFVVPNTKYPFFATNGGVTILTGRVFGYEV